MHIDSAPPWLTLSIDNGKLTTAQALQQEEYAAEE